MASVETQQPTDRVWCLVGRLDEKGPARRIPIAASPFQIGRRTDAHLCLADECASSLHAVLVTEGDSVWVRDLRSTNGTYVNAERLAEPAKLQQGDFVQIGRTVLRVEYDVVAREPQTLHQDDPGEGTLGVVQFDRLISERRLEPYFQPIVQLEGATCVGYEMLIRSRLFGLQLPEQMFQAAAQLDVEAEFSTICRMEGLQASRLILDVPNLFLNTHPSELNDLQLLGLTLQELREANPYQPITLEIHEAAVTDLQVLRELRALLADLEMGLAYDDFGAGQARFQELAEVPPDVLKYDLCLTREIHAASGPRQRMIATLVAMTHDLGIAPLAEGIECIAESLTCQQLGFKLGQGFLYGKPEPVREGRRVGVDTDVLASDAVATHHQPVEGVLRD